MPFSSKIISLVLVLTSSLSFYRAEAKWFSSFEETALGIEAEKKLQKMSLEQKVGQMFLFGFKGKDFSHSLRSLMDETLPGGIIVFSRNIHTARQMVQLNHSLQKTSLQNTGVPLLIALDQEGGNVSRIRTKPAIPSALALGKANDETLSERMGYTVGKLLDSLGFNMNLAPVLDLSDPEKKSFIGTRSFGNNPSQVAKIANAYANGLDAAGVLATGKHFPGHGNLRTDSHKELPEKSANLAELLTSDLMPFSLFMKSVRSPAIMVAHVSYPKIDSTRKPATFSRPILTDLLRQRLKYDGLVITDDIEMAATQGVGNFEERAIQAVNAGADLIMVAWSRPAQKKAVRAVLQAIRSKRISMQTIDSAVRRILITKLKYTSFQKASKPNLNIFRQVSKSQYLKDLSQTILEKNFFHSLNQLSEKSFVQTSKTVHVISANQKFARQFAKKSLLPTKWHSIKTPSAVTKKDKNSYVIVYVTGKGSARVARRLPAHIKSKTLVVNADTPGLINQRSKYLGVIDIFSSNYDVTELIAENVIRNTKDRKRFVAKTEE